MTGAMTSPPTIHTHLQNTTKPWASLLVIPPDTAPSTLVKVPEGFLLRVVHGGKCRTPAGTLKEFSRALEFPDYCGCTWDALEECLIDLEWLPAKGYVVLITEAQSVIPDDEEEYETLLEILNDVGEAWSKGQTTSGRRAPFHVCFGVSEANRTKRKHWGVDEFPLALPNPSIRKRRRARTASRSPRNQRT
jgi:hypothetical protein